jgi:hypothetical protein
MPAILSFFFFFFFFLRCKGGTHSPGIERTTLSSNSPLPSYLAHALQKVNENKKLRAQLKSSIDPDPDLNSNNLPNNPPSNNPPSNNSRSNNSCSTHSSTLLHPPAGHNSTTFSTKKRVPIVYSIDSDDEDQNKAYPVPPSPYPLFFLTRHQANLPANILPTTTTLSLLLPPLTTQLRATTVKIVLVSCFMFSLPRMTNNH